MNIGKKTSWRVAAVTAAALLGGVAQANDWDFDHDGYREFEHHDYDHHHARHHERYENRYADRYYYPSYNSYPDRYPNRYGGHGYGGYNDYRWREHVGHNHQLRDDLEFWAPPFSPPWLYRHGFFGR